MADGLSPDERRQRHGDVGELSQDLFVGRDQREVQVLGQSHELAMYAGKHWTPPKQDKERGLIFTTIKVDLPTLPCKFAIVIG